MHWHARGTNADDAYTSIETTRVPRRTVLTLAHAWAGASSRAAARTYTGARLGRRVKPGGGAGSKLQNIEAA